MFFLFRLSKVFHGDLAARNVLLTDGNVVFNGATTAAILSDSSVTEKTIAETVMTKKIVEFRLFLQSRLHRLKRKSKICEHVDEYATLQQNCSQIWSLLQILKVCHLKCLVWVWICFEFKHCFFRGFLGSQKCGCHSGFDLVDNVSGVCKSPASEIFSSPMKVTSSRWSTAQGVGSHFRRRPSPVPVPQPLRRRRLRQTHLLRRPTPFKSVAPVSIILLIILVRLTGAAVLFFFLRSVRAKGSGFTG